MAVGTHWEWRAFGRVSLTHYLEIIGGLGRHFAPDDMGTKHVDDYLTAPGSRVNVKLRGDKLKFKRCLETRPGGYELWTEISEETFTFPLQSDAFEFMHTHMGVKRPAGNPACANSVTDLRAALGSFDPPIHLVPVRKHRIQFDLVIDGASLLVELAELTEPVPTWSLSIEGPNLGAPEAVLGSDELDASHRHLVAAVERFGLPDQMEVAGYSQMLERWAGAR